MYTAAALHALNFYSFGLEEEKEVCFGRFCICLKEVRRFLYVYMHILPIQ